MQDELGHHPPEGESREEEGEGEDPPQRPGLVLGLQAVVELLEPVAGILKRISDMSFPFSDLMMGPDTTTGM